jgi:hypothetical protein
MIEPDPSGPSKSSGAFAFAFADLDPAAINFLVTDALITAGRALATISTDAPETLAAFDDLSARAAAAHLHPFALAIDEDARVSTGVAAIVFTALLYHWHSGAADTALNTIRAFELLDPPGYPVGVDRDSRILYRVLSALEGLTPLQLERRWDASSANRASRAFLDLASMLDDGAHTADALACAQAATNLAVEEGDAKARGLALSIALGRKAGNRDSAAFAAALRANTLAKLAASHPERRIDAYNALEIAARELPGDPKLREMAGRLLDEWLRKADYLRPLGPVFWLSLRPEERKALPVDVAALAVAAQTLWDGDVVSWLRETKVGVQWAMEIEDARLALEPPVPRERAGAVWTTWSMSHPALARAIPHGTSLEREEDFLETLLVLNHEITHVYSMAGQLGLADQALRWALFEREIDLWSFTVPEGARIDPHEVVRSATVAPLRRLRVEALPQAEQALELALKMRLLEAVWAPWL